MTASALGIDVGGTSIKAGLVDLATGRLLSEHVHVPTPVGGRPNDIAVTVRHLVEGLVAADTRIPVGICFPAVVRRGRTLSAANISNEWVGLHAESLFADELQRTVSIVNDADAAGFAEARFGAAKHVRGLVAMVTLGTGIGTALIHDGVLIPNSELGHLEIEGVDWETQAAVSAKERENLSWAAWANRVQTYCARLESLINPELIIVGGGVSATPERFLPLLRLSTPLVAATLHNQAGVTGVAALASIDQRELLSR
ncbi:MAG: polyphosphate--glucose phosphotransferase [Pseudoclavibacter sp.]